MTQMIENTPAAAPAPVPALVAAPPALLKLDLACGQNPKEGFEGVDIWSGAKHVVDLWKFPWPWKDNSVEEIHCSHHIEHIPAREIEDRDLVVSPKKDGIEAWEAAVKEWVGKDMFFAFFDECWRILRNGGKMAIHTPCARNNRAFQDPTHRRFIVAETFLYLHEPFRKVNKLDHYRARCNFDVKCDPVVNADMTLLHPEAQNRRFTEGWNTVIDWSALITAIKPEKPA